MAIGIYRSVEDNYLKAGQYWHTALGIGDRVIGGSSSSGEWGAKEIIMEKGDHTSFAFTKRYLGITDDELKEAAEGLNL